MTDMIILIIGIAVATGLLLSSIITTFCCFQRYIRSQSRSNDRISKHQPQPQQQLPPDYFQSVIVNQHVPRPMRPSSTISFISDSYHNNMTLIASPHRLALLEQQQQQQRQLQDPGTLVIENPLVSLSNNAEERRPALIQSYVYENPTLELGELSPNGAM